MRVDGRPPSVEVATLIAVGSGSPAWRACSNRAAKVALASDNRSMVVMRLLWAGCGHHRTRPRLHAVTGRCGYWTMKLTFMFTRHSVMLPLSSVITLTSLTHAPLMFLT